MIYGSDLNDIFDRVFGGNPNVHYKTSIIRNDDTENNYEINHTKDGAYLFFDAPGFNKSTLKVEMENGNLYISGSRTYKLNGDEKVKTIKKEFRIGDGYDPSSVEATIEDGLLTVFVPNFKKQEKKRISIL
jgi:HSP20 family molecular chaperone IbpA